jgi:hypothetical protein
VNPPHPPDSSNPTPRITQVGPDRVHVGRERIVIEAAHPMDCPVREFCKVPIYFEGRKYYVRNHSTAPQPFAKRYELWPWPADLHEESNRSVIYSEAYVAERDRAAQKQRSGAVQHALLSAFYPLLGLFWSGFKNQTLLKLGFEPRSITSASVMLIFSLFVLEGVFVGWFGTGILVWLFHGMSSRNLDWILLVVMGADTVMRYSQLQDLDTQRHWGFCEWIGTNQRSRK